MDFIDENVILNKLVDKRNGVKHYRLIKSSITEGWVTALKSASNQENILKNEYNKIQNVLHLGRENKMSLKQVQCILKNDAFKSKYQTKWESMFNASINWKNQWKCVLETPLTNKEKQLHWKILHNAIFTKYKLSLMGRSDGKCHFCKIETECLIHLFCECKVTKDVLKKIQTKINGTLQSKGYGQRSLDL